MGSLLTYTQSSRFMSYDHMLISFRDNDNLNIKNLDINQLARQLTQWPHSLFLNLFLFSLCKQPVEIKKYNRLLAVIIIFKLEANFNGNGKKVEREDSWLRLVTRTSETCNSYTEITDLDLD